MMHNQGCETCGGFIPCTELLGPRCRNENGAPLTESRIFQRGKYGCGIWSPCIPKAD